MEVLHREIFTQRSFYTQTLDYTGRFLQREVFTLHKEIFPMRSLYILCFYTDAFTQRSLYTEELLHTEAFTQRSLYTEEFAHTEAFTRSFYTEKS